VELEVGKLGSDGYDEFQVLLCYDEATMKRDCLSYAYGSSALALCT